jgi:hypothetical protein
LLTIRRIVPDKQNRSPSESPDSGPFF